MPKSTALQAGIVAAMALALCLGAYVVDRNESRKHEESRREEVRAAVAGVRTRLEGALNERIHLVRGLEALALLRPNITQHEFAAFARALERQDSGIRALQLAKGGVVSHIYPEATNQPALGHSLLADPRTAAMAAQAIETRQMRVAGPYPLRQGSTGLVARLPVFSETGDTPEFWGFAIVIIDFPQLLESSGIPANTEVALAIRGRDGAGKLGEVFVGDAAVFDAQAVTTEVHFPNGQWLLAAQPREGWGEPWPGRTWLIVVTLLLVAAVPPIAALLRRMLHSQGAVERLRLRERLLASLGEGVYGIDRAGRCTFINPAAQAMLGWSREEVIGRNVRGLFHDPTALAPAFRNRANEGLMRRRDGSEFPVRMSYDPFDDGEGGVVAFNDVSAQKADAERLRLAASVFAHAQQGIMITNAAGKLVDVNPAFTEITGYTRDEVLGRSPRMLSSGRQPPEFYAVMKKTLDETGAWRGEIWNRHKNGEVYPELLCIAAVPGDDGKPSHFIGVFSDISRQKQHEAELARIAHFDPLTGLPNRVLMTDRLNQGLATARSSRGRVALGMLDLDRFKEVNDHFGHDIGDHVLIEVAKRLKQAVRGSDTVARFGGDEFVLLLTAVAGVASCEAQAHRLIEALRAPFDVAGHRIELSASIGFTLFPDDSSDAETLLRHADQAMYLAKQLGGGRYRLFDPEQDRQARCQRETLDHIAQAIERGELRLFYQPKVDMHAGRVLGFEALVRWQHPQQGLLGPAAFLPVISATDLDADLGRWVLREAVRQLGEWRSQGLRFGLSVNISASHLLAPGFLQELDAVLAAQPQVDPGALEIEVLETAAFDDLEAATAILHGCLERGLGVAIDDFGTGYSSLAYFKHLPARTLKIDQIFIRDMLRNEEDSAMVEGIIRFARAFNREIIAEGVECGELCAKLVEMGCHVGQGYGIAPPMPAERVPEWVHDFRPSPAWTQQLRRSA